MTDSNQSLRQASVRATSGTTGTYEGDFHALWDLESIASGAFDERMLAWINARLVADYTDISSAMQAFAEYCGVTNWDSLGMFTAGTTFLVLLETSGFVELEDGSGFVRLE